MWSAVLSIMPLMDVLYIKIKVCNCQQQEEWEKACVSFHWLLFIMGCISLLLDLGIVDGF